eukprot:3837656-Rhodomonas_salina.1
MPKKESAPITPTAAMPKTKLAPPSTAIPDVSTGQRVGDSGGVGTCRVISNIASSYLRFHVCASARASSASWCSVPFWPPCCLRAQ